MTGRFPVVDATASRLAGLVLARPPVHDGRVVAVDGPSGAGKTTLAAALRRSLRDAGQDVRLLHLDNVYDGWDGLAAGIATAAREVVAPYLAGTEGRYRRYDWHRGRFAEEHVVAPGGVLVVEGVGAGAACAGTPALVVWLDAPPDVRLERGVARDGEELRGRLLAWHAQEAEVLAAAGTRERADVRLDGTFAQPPGD